MYCVNCGKKLEENQKFCSACGQPVVGIKQTENNPQNQYGIENNEFRKRQEDHKQYIKNSTQEQPTKALVIEGFGIVFFAMTIILDRSSDYMDQLWVKKYGWVLYMIGFILLVIPYFIFKKYKKKYGLQGIGYAGYIISCMGTVVVALFIILMIITIALSAITGV